MKTTIKFPANLAISDFERRNAIISDQRKKVEAANGGGLWQARVSDDMQSFTWSYST